MLNEFRQDPITGEWILFSTNRVLRPHHTSQTVRQTAAECPFERPLDSNNEILASYPQKSGDDWRAMAVTNKYSFFQPVVNDSVRTVGPFAILPPNGSSEVIIFRDHNRSLYEFTSAEAYLLFEIWRERFQLLADSGNSYVIPFYNQGINAGGSLDHPHAQIMATSLIPMDVRTKLDTVRQYYERQQLNIYEVMLAWEIAEKHRIMYENDSFVALCPFVSRIPYEIRIFPKASSASFEQISETDLAALSNCFTAIVRMLEKALNKPDFNLFIHTLPPGIPTAALAYRWHIEIMPQLTIPGGFELGSGLRVNTIDPDEAAEKFRNNQ